MERASSTCPRIDDYERAAPELVDDAGQAERPSPGQLLEAAATAVVVPADAAESSRIRTRMRGVAAGRTIAYAAGSTGNDKHCRIGKVKYASEDGSSVTVLVFRPRLDHSRFRLLWEQAYADEAGILETIAIKRVLGTVELNGGVLNHASSRRLEKAGWRLEEGTITTDGAVQISTVQWLANIIDHAAARAEQITAACHGDLKSPWREARIPPALGWRRPSLPRSIRGLPSPWRRHCSRWHSRCR